LLPKVATKPNWASVQLPEDNEYIYSYGISDAFNKSFTQARKESINNARHELANVISAKITSDFVKSTTVTNVEDIEIIKESVNDTLLVQSHVYLPNTFSDGYWVDYEYCFLWTRIKLNKKHYAEAKEQSEKKSLDLLEKKINSVDRKIDSVTKKISKLKKETSDNPKKELMNLGIEYTDRNLLLAVRRGDIQALTLFLDSGMSLGDVDLHSPINNMLTSHRLDKFESLLHLLTSHPNSDYDINNTFYWYIFESLSNLEQDKIKALIKFGAKPDVNYSGLVLSEKHPKKKMFRLYDVNSYCALSMIRQTNNLPKREQNINKTEKLINSKLNYDSDRIEISSFDVKDLGYDIFSCKENKFIRINSAKIDMKEKCLKHVSKIDHSLMAEKIIRDAKNNAYDYSYQNSDVKLASKFMSFNNLREAAYSHVYPALYENKQYNPEIVIEMLKLGYEMSCDIFQYSLCLEPKKDGEFPFCHTYDRNMVHPNLNKI
tara:strand:- start:1922 stop:3388 length:1467 start_codon:yes stop_codon:yes gene_type:complete